jgi:outer membrane protein assembly factor BamB
MSRTSLFARCACRYTLPILALFVGWFDGRSTAQADDWPQFRGANCRGITAAKAKLPVQFSTTKNVAWSAEVGDGVGGAVIASGRLFVTGMSDKETVTLHAFDAASGKSLWKRNWPTGKLPEIHGTNSPASSTPVADNERVCFYFTTLGLVCVDALTGDDRWRQKLPVPFFVMKWGAGVSPVLSSSSVRTTT